MQKTIKIVTLLVILQFFLSLIPFALAIPNQTTIVHEGWKEIRNEITVVHLSGDFYTMGYQLGTLLHDEILITMRAHMHGAGQMGATEQDFADLWAIQKPYIANKTLQYFQGTADALNLSLKDIGYIWIWEGVLLAKRCTSFALWGNATQHGELIYVRSLDALGYLQDPITQSYAQEYPVVVICEPDTDHAFLYPTLAGYSVEDGFNAHGVSVCNLWSINFDDLPHGSPMGVRLFEALYMASSGEEAIEIITTNESFGYNYVVGDANIPAAYAVETTHNLTYVGSWDHPSENTYPFFAMNDVIRRSNCYIDPTLAATQRPIYSPLSLRYLLNFKQSYGWINSWLRYKALSTAFQRSYGDIDTLDGLNIMRNMYSGRYNLVWWLLEHNHDIFAQWQWSAQPSNGDMYYSFVSVDDMAYRNEIHHLNLFEELQKK